IASSATLALNSAENRLRVFMVDHPFRHRIHLNHLSQKPGPPLFVAFQRSEDETEIQAGSTARIRSAGPRQPSSTKKAENLRTVQLLLGKAPFAT
ncbi:MAG: hypothetical protein WBD76_14045, partial [Methyloceanibacter sp.]